MATFRIFVTKRGYCDVEAKNKDKAIEAMHDVEFEEKEETVENVEEIN